MRIPVSTIFNLKNKYQTYIKSVNVDYDKELNIALQFNNKGNKMPFKTFCVIYKLLQRISDGYDTRTRVDCLDDYPTLIYTIKDKGVEKSWKQ